METQEERTPHTLRAPCGECGGAEGYLVPTKGQDVVRCARCDAFAYNAPKVETGRGQRSVTPTHRPVIKPRRRFEVLARYPCCVVCGVGAHRDRWFEVGHLIPLTVGRKMDIPSEFLCEEWNLAPMCAECNSGAGETLPPLWLLARAWHWGGRYPPSGS